MLRGECEAVISTAPKKKGTGTGVTRPSAESLKKKNQEIEHITAVRTRETVFGYAGQTVYCLFLGLQFLSIAVANHSGSKF